MKLDQVLAKLRALANEENRQGMARYGINTESALGIKVTTLRQVAKETGRDHALALQLWDSGFHEARILATIIEDPRQMTKAQAESWLKDINSWDLCDGFAGNLIDKTSFAYEKAVVWSEREAEFELRAGLAVMAWLPVHDKKAPDETFAAFFAYIEAASDDERIYVKKAVSWALRNNGKRSLGLNAKAVTAAERIGARGSKAATWIAKVVLKELTSEKVRERLAEKDA